MGESREQELREEELKMFRETVHVVSETMNLPVSFWLVDKERQSLRIVASVGLRPEYASKAFLLLSEPSVTGQAVKQNEVISSYNLLSDPSWKYKDEAREMGWQSVLCVPVRAQKTVLGVLSIYGFSPRPFSDMEKSLLIALAAQFEATFAASRQGKMVDRLLQIGNEFEQLIAQGSAVVLQKIVWAACEVTGADCAVIYPYDAARKDFYDIHSVAAFGLWEKLELTDKPRNRPDGMTAFVKREGEVVLADIAKQDSPMQSSPFIKREGIKAFVGIALRLTTEEDLGILFVDFRSPHDFSEEELAAIRVFARQAAIAIDNSRLYMAVNLRASALTRLHEVNSNLLSIPGTQEQQKALLTQIATSAQEVLGADLIDLYQYYQTRDDFELPPIQVGQRRKPQVRKDKVLADDVIRRIVEFRAPSYVVDSQKEAGLTGPYTAGSDSVSKERFVFREEIASTAALPLIAGTEVVGVMFANYRTPQPFSIPQRELIELFATQAAIAIRNVRLFTQRQVLQEITRDITGILDKNQLLQSILNRSIGLLGCETGSICLFNKATNELEHQFSVGKEKFANIPFGQGLIGTAAQTCRPVRVGDVTKDGRYIEHVAGTRSELDVPMLIRDKLVGVLNAESPRHDAFDEESEALALLLAGQAAIALDNADLFQRTQEQLEQRLKDLRSLHDVYEAVGQEPQEKILKLVVEQAVSLTSAQYGTLWLLDRSQNELVFGVEHSFLQVLPRVKARLPLDGRSINGWVALKGEPYRCPDVRDDPHYEKVNPEVRAELAVPLRHSGRIIGTLNVESTQQAAFTEDHQRLLEALAAQAATVIDKARTYQRLDTVLKVSQDVAMAPDLQSVLEQILEKSCQATGASYGTMQLIDRSQGVLRLRAFKGSVTNPKYKELPLGQGITGRVAESGKSMFIGDVLSDGDYLGYLEGTRSELAVPILVRGSTIGVLNVEHPQPFAFDEQDQHLLEAIAHQVGTLIRNAQLYDARKTVNEVGEKLTMGSRLHKEEILQLIHEQASKLMDTNNMYIALYDEPINTVTFGLAYVNGDPINVAEEPGWQPRKAGQGRTEEVIRTKEPLFHPTRADADRWYALPGHKEYVGGALPSWLGVPMLVGERVLGAIAVYHPDREDVYTKDDQYILQAMANQAAVALDNADMFFNANKRLAALVKFGEWVGASIHLGEPVVLKLVHESASEVVDTGNMYVALYDPLEDSVRFGFAYIDGKPVDTVTDPRWQPRKAGQGRTEEVIRTRQSLFHATGEEARAWYDKKEHKEYLNQPLASWMGVPMLVGDRVLGAVAVYHPTKDYAFTGEDLQALQGIANQAAIALDNARLYENAREEVIVTRQLAVLGTAMAALQHRINNSFNVIIPCVARLRKRVNMEDPTMRQILEIIERNAQYTSQLIHRILEPLQEQKQQGVNINAVLGNLANEAAELWKMGPARPNVSVTLQLDESIPTIRVPIGQVSEVFRNLIENASRAMPEGGKLSLLSCQDKGKICVRVADTGSGIPPAIRPRLFRKPVSSAGPESSTGLGLWLSQLMLQSFGGEIEVEKSDPNGTVMLVKIPLLQEEAKEVRA